MKKLNFFNNRRFRYKRPKLNNVSILFCVIIRRTKPIQFYVCWISQILKHVIRSISEIKMFAPFLYDRHCRIKIILTYQKIERLFSIVSIKLRKRQDVRKQLSQLLQQICISSWELQVVIGSSVMHYMNIPMIYFKC